MKAVAVVVILQLSAKPKSCSLRFLLALALHMDRCSAQD